MPEVELIVNYDLPKHYKDYVHRTGRTARQGRAGRCVSFAGPDEYLPMRNLEKEFPGELARSSRIRPKGSLVLGRETQP